VARLHPESWGHWGCSVAHVRAPQTPSWLGGTWRLVEGEGKREGKRGGGSE